MICSSEKRFFTSNLLGVGNWTPNGGATQNRGGRRPDRVAVRVVDMLDAGALPVESPRLP
ncbi:hypothetical protein XthCFBP4691_17255 [Xanthomonas theicola]|uniref:Uncharacterized protein n=1 Tax=Xanthomonas theicola TaxID=56464 RepID=A0A2S6ZBG8_9XANT|nr:hypothetical protein XthCFBP4691_17255 [Xanthomonas theicola]